MIAASLRKIRSLVEGVAVVANVSGAFVLLALVAVMNVDVIARGVFNAPFRGVVEVVIFSLVLIVFLQLPDVVRTGRLTRSDGFPSLMRARAPQFGEALERAIHAISCIFMGMIVWTVWPEFVEAFESCHFFSQPEFGPAPTGAIWTDFMAALARCDYFGTPGILTVPWWPARLAIAFGCAWAAILFFFKAALGDPEPRTVDQGEV
ncbi:TRAP transporter small permease subunit [uncultured Litoreibacter sp.]|uniref:TRAP transporter small permease subunit n=1 Tax=uncultured Litoreibacter sp. TaxID=1392394 RepID=UPI002637575F|nr:TRAP transporter small permease subunit [uncultured Litoreibacter sp.]